MNKVLLLTITLSIVLSTAIIIPTASAAPIPTWIKNTASWWADGTVDDATFLSSIKFLIENNIIVIEEKNTESTPDKRVLAINFVGDPVVVKGKIQFVKVIVTNDRLSIPGASLDINIISPSGKTILISKEGTDSAGEFIITVPIDGSLESGTYKVDVKADRKGFSPVLQTFSFRVR